MKIYVVFSKSKNDEILIIGVYDSREKAIVAEKQFETKFKDKCAITAFDEFELNKLNY